MSSENDMRKEPKLWIGNFVLIILINFLVFVSHMMVLSTFPFYIRSRGGSVAGAGFAAVLFSLVAVICRPFIGWMLNNGRRKVILLIGIAGMALMPLGYMFVPAFSLIFFCQNDTWCSTGMFEYNQQYNCDRHHSPGKICRRNGNVRCQYGACDGMCTGTGNMGHEPVRIRGTFFVCDRQYDSGFLSASVSEASGYFGEKNSISFQRTDR